MSNEKHETVTDNVSANHQFREVAKMIPHEEVAVSKMETTTQTCEKSSVVGNAAVMLDALDMLLGLFDSGLVEYSDSCDHSDTAQIQYVIDKAEAALSAPPRNCDLGTPEEQSSRFDAHCRKHMGCLTCPLREKDGGVPKHCEFAWSQMPYDGVK